MSTMAPNGNTREFSLSLDSDLKKVLPSGPTAGLDQVTPTEVTPTEGH